MVVNRLCDQLSRCVRHASIEVLYARIQSADNPLQLSKFFNQFSGEIGLSEARSFVHDTRPDCDSALLNGFRQPAT